MREQDSTDALVTWTLCGPRDVDIFPDALRSVADLADRCLAVWTGPSPIPADFLRDAYGTETDTGPLVRARWWPWRDDFAAARNAGLQFAADEPRAGWCAMVDADERIICPNPAALRSYLAALPLHVVVALAHHQDGSHTRERFFRLPCSARFVGRTHETFPVPLEAQALIPRELVLWSELPKSAETLRAKFLRDVDMLRADLADDPKNGAAHYYLGETLQSLGDHEEAIDHFRTHNTLSRWEEGRAWAAFKAAESYFALGQPYRVLECAAQGLVHDAGMAELYWIAAVACWAQAAKASAEGTDPGAWVEQARCWAMGALHHGAGSESEARRIGKRDVRGLRTGPAEVLEAVRVAREVKP